MPRQHNRPIQDRKSKYANKSAHIGFDAHPALIHEPRDLTLVRRISGKSVKSIFAALQNIEGKRIVQPEFVLLSPDKAFRILDHVTGAAGDDRYTRMLGAAGIDFTTGGSQLNLRLHGINESMYNDSKGGRRMVFMSVQDQQTSLYPEGYQVLGEFGAALRAANTQHRTYKAMVTKTTNGRSPLVHIPIIERHLDFGPIDYSAVNWSEMPKGVALGPIEIE